MNATEEFKQDQFGIADELGKKFGLDSNQVRSAMEWITPAVTRGLKRRASESSGLSDLWKALGNGNHEKYVEDPSHLQRPETKEEGNSILGHIFGSKEVSRNVAERASQETGISSSILKQMLPFLASAVMGALSKKMSPISGDQPDPKSQSVLMSWLDADKDGSVMDDMLGLAFKRLTS